MSILDRIASSYQAYGSYLWNEISHPSWHNYFYWLIGVSIFAWSLEYFIPWRTKQPIVRKDFWLDFFYMFFNGEYCSNKASYITRMDSVTSDVHHSRFYPVECSSLIAL